MLSVQDRTLTLDLETGERHGGDATQGVTTVVLGNPPEAGRAASLAFILRQNSIGWHELTWPGAVRWFGDSPPAISRPAGAVYIYRLFTRDGGATWYGMVGGHGFA